MTPRQDEDKVIRSSEVLRIDASRDRKCSLTELQNFCSGGGSKDTRQAQRAPPSSPDYQKHELGDFELRSGDILLKRLDRIQDPWQRPLAGHSLLRPGSPARFADNEPLIGEDKLSESPIYGRQPARP